MIDAYKTAVAPLLASTPIDELTLHLPDVFERSTLKEGYFSSIDETDQALRSSLALTKLNGLGLNDLSTLIIKSINNAGKYMFNIDPIAKVDYDWEYFKNLFSDALTLNEIS